MSTVTDSVLIRRGATEVFAYFADVRTFREWGTGVLTLEQTAGDGPGVGAAYRFTRRIGGRDVAGTITVMAYDTDRMFVLRGESGGMPWLSRSTIESVGDGTRVTESITLQPRGLVRLAGFVIAMLVRRTHRRDLANLKSRLETA